MGILYINFINTRISVTGSSIVVYNNITIIIGLEPGAVIVLIFTILLFIV